MSSLVLCESESSAHNNCLFLARWRRHHLLSARVGTHASERASEQVGEQHAPSQADKWNWIWNFGGGALARGRRKVHTRQPVATVRA